MYITIELGTHIDLKNRKYSHDRFEWDILNEKNISHSREYRRNIEYSMIANENQTSLINHKAQTLLFSQ